MSSQNHQEFQRPVRWDTRDLFNVSGDLYTAQVLDSEDNVVVKKVQIAKDIPQEEANALFKKLKDRVKFLKSLSHPNLLKYLGTSKKGRTLYILSECAGHSYKSSRFKKQKQFTELEQETRKITHQLLLGLKFLHEQKIVNGNIKIENIFVDGNGNVKLADFGLSKELTAATGPMGAEGNPQFKTDHINLTADERHWLDGKIADVRNVGRIVVEMLKRKPWSERLEKSIKAELPSPGRNFIVKCLTWLPDSKVEISDLIQDPFITPQVGNTGLLQHATKALQDTLEAAKQTGYTIVGNAVETAKQTGYKAVENAFEAAKQTGNKAVETAAQTSHTAGHIAGVAARNGIRMTDEFGKGYREGKGESEDEEQKQHAPKAEAAKRKDGEKVSHSGPKVVKNEAKFAPAAKPILTEETLEDGYPLRRKTEKRPCCMFSCCYF